MLSRYEKCSLIFAKSCLTVFYVLNNYIKCGVIQVKKQVSYACILKVTYSQSIDVKRIVANKTQRRVVNISPYTTLRPITYHNTNVDSESTNKTLRLLECLE